MSLTPGSKLYFVGIGGIGMSAAAGIAAAKGFDVFGSDAGDIYQPSKGVLEKFGVGFVIGYSKQNIDNYIQKKGRPDAVVVTSAVDQTNPELAETDALGIPIISFAELFADLAKDKKRVVVCGTNGKGSTSGLLAYVLRILTDSSFFVGGVLNNLETNFYYGPGPYFVLEGDEYKSTYKNLTPKFSYYHPDILLINNLELDHPDIYPDLDALKKVFRQLVEGMSEDSLIIYNADDINIPDVISGAKGKLISFGFKNSSADIIAKPPHMNNGLFEMDVTLNIEAVYADSLREDNSGKPQQAQFTLESPLPGQIYAYNNLAACAVLIALGQRPEDFLPLVKAYTGLRRRYQIIEDGKITIIDDYAHHPTAVRETLEATRLKYPGRRIICVFEPHTYSRTKETLPQLINAFAAADIVFISEVYPAREQTLPSSINGAQVVAAVSQCHSEVRLVKDKKDALEKLSLIIKPDDVVVVMAVGSFNHLANDLKQSQYEITK